MKTENVQSNNEEKEDDEFSLGNNSIDCYENSYFNFGFKPNDEWVLADDETLKEYLQAVLQAYSDMSGSSETIKKALEAGGSITDMFAQNINGMDSVSVAIEKANILTTFINVDQYLEVTKATLETTLKESGYVDLNCEIGDIDFAGRTERGLMISADISIEYSEGNIIDIPFYQTLVVLKKGSYFSAITASSVLENNTYDYISLFYNVK